MKDGGVMSSHVDSVTGGCQVHGLAVARTARGNRPPRAERGAVGQSTTWQGGAETDGGAAAGAGWRIPTQVPAAPSATPATRVTNNWRFEVAASAGTDLGGASVADCGPR